MRFHRPRLDSSEVWRSLDSSVGASPRRKDSNAKRAAPRLSHIRGQSLAEFAIIAPLFFFLFFTVINGGLFLFVRNSVQHAANAGAAEIAAEGDTPADGDQIAIQAMNLAGLSNTVLTTVTSITLQREDPGTVGSGTYTPDTSCGSSGSSACLDTYTAADGVPTNSPCNLTGTATSTPPLCIFPSPTEIWTPSDRNVGQGQGLAASPDYALLTVNYKFTAIGGFASFTETATVLFRLEPQVGG